MVLNNNNNKHNQLILRNLWPCIKIFFNVHKQLLVFYVHVTTNFFSIKTNQTLEFPQFYFVIKTLHVSGISFVHHQELSTVHSAIGTFHVGYVTASKQSQVWTQFQPDSAWKRSHSLHEAYQLPCVQWITPNDGHRRCPKHVGFYDKNIFWILMHLVGCFYEIYHDARSPEHKDSLQYYFRYHIYLNI